MKQIQTVIAIARKNKKGIKAYQVQELILLIDYYLGLLNTSESSQKSNCNCKKNKCLSCHLGSAKSLKLTYQGIGDGYDYRNPQLS